MSDYNKEEKPKVKLNWDKDAYAKLQKGATGKKDEDEEDEENKKPGFLDRIRSWMDE